MARCSLEEDAVGEARITNIIDIISTDHAPHTEIDKLCEFALAQFGISGFETALGSLMGLVHNGKLNLKTLIAKLTHEPVKIIGDKHGKLGTLAIGSQADVTIFNPGKEWLVNPNDFASRGRNTPLAGSTLKGKVMTTIFKGEIVYQDDSIKIEASG